MPKDYPCTAEEALERMQRVTDAGGQYILGTGDYWPHTEAGKDVDLPWTARQGAWGADCAGAAICYAWKLARGRKGFNVGGWATVSDDINSDSAFEDAHHKQELFTVAEYPTPGDLLIYPSVRRGNKRLLIGHVGMVEAVPAEWDKDNPQYDLLTVLQACGPNYRKPGIIRTNGATWTKHDKLWIGPRGKYLTKIIRPRERT